MATEEQKASSRKRSRRYYHKNRSKILAAKSTKQRSQIERRRIENPERFRLQIRKRTLKMYGLSPEQYQDLLRRQNGVCRICFQVDATGQILSVDHDHSTGIVRGLLCSACNKGLGFFRDSITRLSAAQRYLIETGGGSDGR